MCFMWNSHRVTRVDPDQIRRLLSIPERCQAMIPEKRFQYHPLHLPDPHVVTMDSDSNEPAMPYGFGRQLSCIPPSLNDLNLLPNRFNILATKAVVNLAEHDYDENYSPQSPEPSKPSPISTPPINISSIDGWETPQTTTDDNTVYSDDEPRRIYFLPSTNPPRHPGS